MTVGRPPTRPRARAAARPSRVARDSAKSSVSEGDGDFLKTLDQEVEKTGLFDAKLSARLEGPSFKGIPIAIHL